MAIPTYWLPESPRWLLTRGLDAEGTAVIAALRGLEIDSKETILQRQIILDSIAASGYAGKKNTPLKACFTGGKTQHFRRMMLGVSSQFMQQVGGKWVFELHCPPVLQAEHSRSPYTRQLDGPYLGMG